MIDKLKAQALTYVGALLSLIKSLKNVFCGSKHKILFTFRLFKKKLLDIPSEAPTSIMLRFFFCPF